MAVILIRLRLLSFDQISLLLIEFVVGDGNKYGFE